MKTFIKYISVAIAAIALCSCEDSLRTVPEGSTKTSEQKAEANQQNPSTQAADLAAVYAKMIELFAGLGDLGYERHNDFGYAATCLFTDADADVVSLNIGYNWFSGNFESRNNTLTTSGGLICNAVWNLYYKIIYACNSIIGLCDPENPGATVYNLSQAYAVRAFCYLGLAQLYQFNPVVNAANYDKPCVPIVDANMSSEKQANNPRATVKEVYDFIFKDLNYACEHLKGYKRPDKGFVDQAVAYGIRARANLVVGNWAAAAADADQCLTLSGAKPYSIKEVSKPGFCSAAGNSVLWANIIVESNDIVQTGIVNWPSHLSSLFTDGYTGVGSYRSIPSDLYESIPATDVRKGWWLNSSLTSPILTGNYADWQAEILAAGDPSTAYINVKFGVAGDNMTTLTAAADWILMRAEEMILIKAEGLARSGGNGKAVLEDFVKTYRDPSYTQYESTIENEIWRQRRIELWGEGFSFQDYMRLGKDINRKNATNWPAAWNFNIPAGHGCLLWRIPQSETQANAGIPESANNPFVAHPTI